MLINNDMINIRVLQVVPMLVVCFGVIETSQIVSLKADTAIDNRTCPHHLNPFGKYSENACAVMCASVSECDGFSYLEQGNVCRMCNKSVYAPSRSLDVLSGAKTYLLPCSRQWGYFGGSCYFIVSTLQNFDTAKTYCGSQAIGGHLIYIETQAEKDFVVGMLDEKYQSVTAPNKIWIGGYDNDTNVFRWLDGNPVNNAGFSDWGGTEPSNTGGESCLAAASFLNYGWSDDYCFQSYVSLCEVESQWV